MKTIIRLILTGMLLATPTGLVWPVAKSYPVSAQVPLVVIATIALTKVMAVDRTNPVNWIKDQTAINFGTLQYDSNTGIWLPDNFYVIDVASNFNNRGGYVSFAYTEGAMPTGQTIGLGRKTGVSFFKVVQPASGPNVETEITAMRELRDINLLRFTPEQIKGGWLRTYVGISDGDPKKAGLPFAGDKPGSYTGTLMVSIVVAT